MGICARGTSIFLPSSSDASTPHRHRSPSTPPDRRAPRGTACPLRSVVYPFWRKRCGSVDPLRMRLHHRRGVAQHARLARQMPREQRRPRRIAQRKLAVVAIEPNAPRAQRINVRTMHIEAAVVARQLRPHVVGHEEQHIQRPLAPGLARRRLRLCSRRQRYRQRRARRLGKEAAPADSVFFPITHHGPRIFIPSLLRLRRSSHARSSTFASRMQPASMRRVQRAYIGAALAHAVHYVNLDRCRNCRRPWSQHARQINLVPGKHVHRNLARQRRARRRSADDQRSVRSGNFLHASGKGRWRRCRCRCRRIRWRLRVAMNSNQPHGAQHNDAHRETPGRFPDSRDSISDSHSFLSPSDVRSLTNVSPNRPDYVLRSRQRGDAQPDVPTDADCGGVRSTPGNETP